jgi:hypothetical protein
MNVSFALQDTAGAMASSEGAWDANLVASRQRIGQLAVGSLRHGGLEDRPVPSAYAYFCRDGTRATPCPEPMRLGSIQVPGGD